MNTRRSAASLAALFLLTITATAGAQVDARMFRQPTVSQTQIAFVYAGDIWIVPKKGGAATRLSSPQGEESFPRFSPDGTKIAYSAAYDGNTDVYVVNAAGGEPVRLTHHPMADRVIGWHPDGKRVLFASSRESGRQRFSQFYLVGLDGGLPEKLPVPYGEFGAFSENGTDFVYMPMSQDFRTWKRYRGGWAPDLWLFNLKTFASRNLTNDPANDAQPMWHGNTVYFVSDRGANQRNNIWALDVASGKPRQITQFTDFDITFPSIGPDSIVFQAGGRLYLMDCGSEKASEVPIRVVTDETTLRPRTAKAEALISDASVSPTGKRAAFGARGDDRHGPGGKRRRRQPHAHVRRCRALSAVVTRWKDRRVLERQERRIRTDAAARRRLGQRAEGDDARAWLPLYPLLVAGQQEAGIHRPGDEDSHLRRGRKSCDRH